MIHTILSKLYGNFTEAADLIALCQARKFNLWNFF